jgi:RNA polymerase sigma factor (sigma-70 family)
MHDLSAPATTPAIPDPALLRKFVRDKSEAAFTKLVERHTDWVYSKALRMVHDPHRAADVTQAVFVLLARKARKLSRNVHLTGWLFLTTRNISRHVVRSEARRRKHEQIAATMNPTATSPSSSEAESLELIKKHLDEGIARLGETDRNALVMRYYANESFTTIAASLGLSEDAARKRVSRALEKLQQRFARRGVTLSLALIAALLEQVTHGAPSSLAADSVRAALITTPGPIALLVGAGGPAMVLTALVAVAGALAVLVPVGMITVGKIRARQTPDVAITTQPTTAPTGPKLPFTTTRPSAMKVGWLVSYSLAHSIDYGNGYHDHVTAIRKRFLDPSIELYALVEPDSMDDDEQKQVIAQNFPPDHTLVVTDPDALRKLDVIVMSRDFAVREDVSAAIHQAVSEGTGLLIHVGPQRVEQSVQQALTTMTHTSYFWTRVPVPCTVVSNHPLLSGLKANLPDGQLNIANLNGCIGRLDEHGTPLIVADDLSRNNVGTPEEVLHPTTQDAPKMYPMYVSQLGKGLIVNCQWDSIPAPLVDLSNGRFYIHCCEYLAHRPLD